MNSVRTTRAAMVLCGALVIAACGGSDDASEAAGEGAAASAAATTVAAEGPVAPTTESADSDLPEELVGEVRPVTVTGPVLPPLETDEIAADPAVGTPAPVLIGENFDGEEVRVDGATDGPTMVVFLAHWCSHCNAEIPVLNELRDAGRFPDDLNIVGISTAVNATRPNFPPSQWLVDKDWTWSAMADFIDFDAEVLVAAEAFGVSGFPFVTVIDGNGNVAARWSGGREADQIIATIKTSLGA